jgi:hypothetical protein
MKYCTSHTAASTSFLVMNPDFHFVLAMDDIVCTAGVENVLRTSVCTRPPVLESEEHGCDSGSESLDKQEPRDILYCHVERRDQSFAVAESQNDRIKNIDSVVCARVEQHPTSIYPTIDWFYASEMRSCHCKRWLHTLLNSQTSILHEYFWP